MSLRPTAHEWPTAITGLSASITSESQAVAHDRARNRFNAEFCRVFLACVARWVGRVHAGNAMYNGEASITDEEFSHAYVTSMKLSMCYEANFARTQLYQDDANDRKMIRDHFYGSIMVGFLTGCLFNYDVATEVTQGNAPVADVEEIFSQTVCSTAAVLGFNLSKLSSRNTTAHTYTGSEQSNAITVLPRSWAPRRPWSFAPALA